MTDTRYFSPEEWEEYTRKLLHQHYPPGEYQQVPDTDRGDLGIEGFSRDGCAYQCYASEGLRSLDDNYQKQRDKLSTDIKKFIDNTDGLSRLFGNLRIRRWILLVPQCESKRLVQFAADKSEEVRSRNLPYVDGDFAILVLTADAYPTAKQQLANIGLVFADLPHPEVGEDDVAAWLQSPDSSASYANLKEKIGRLPTLAEDDAKQRSMIDALLRRYLAGQVVLEKMRTNYPELHRRFADIKSARERDLELQGLAGETVPELRPQLDQLRSALESLQGLSESDLVTLIHESVADWLMRCPLSFPVSPSSGVRS